MSTTTDGLRSLVSAHRNHAALIMLAVVTAIGLSGCLMYERKQYLFLVKPDGTGSGVITFENIVSVQESEADPDQLTKDYTELINGFIKSSKLEDQNPAFQNVRKRLFEKNGKLCGEMTFDFLSYEDVGLFRLDGEGPWMYHSGQLNGVSIETLDSTNGRFGGPRMPVVFWPEATNDFRLETTMEEPEEGSSSHSLLPLFKRIGVR